jgi:hypothetical protein
VQRRNELADGQAATTVQPCEPSRHKPSLGVERILMIDFSSTPTHTKGVAPTTNREEGHTKTAVAGLPKALPPPTADGVDKMYYR